MDEIARVMNLHAGKPFEGRGGDVVIVADADDGRVGIEAGEDGIDNRGRRGGARICRRAVLARKSRANRDGGDSDFMPLSGRGDVRLRIAGCVLLAHQRPQHRGTHEVERRQSDEERGVTNRAHERTDNEIENQQARVATGAGHARYCRDFISFKQVR